ncbi:hypothetical protein [Paraburkholderia sp. J94]|uniref:hypothetical protein n=1 Tax=Paraburkholderia sp. J94 TaxID=2805441 RepID=UPI002AAFE1CA|nr:hypothetical protein [Paraburkholderia sp. J94]
MPIIVTASTLFISLRHFTKSYRAVNFSLSQKGSARALHPIRQGDVMGAAVVAVVFVLGLLGVPTLFGHASHAKAGQQVAAVQTPPGAASDTAAVRSVALDSAASSAVSSAANLATNPAANPAETLTDASRP